jgi:hypothetical protein
VNESWFMWQVEPHEEPFGNAPEYGLEGHGV